MTALLTEPATGRTGDDAQTSDARGTQLPDRAVDGPTPNLPPPGQGQTTPQADVLASSIPPSPAGSQTDDEGQRSAEAQTSPALVVPSPSGLPAMPRSATKTTPLADPTLVLAADILDDLERVKIANANRLRALTRDTEDSDGEMRGFGLDESHPDVARLAALVAMLEKAEHDATLNLQRAMRRHPLGPWVKAQRGIGEKQAARLLATIGDPYLNGNTGLPRTVSALWAYCGLHVISAGGDPGQSKADAQDGVAGVAARRQKGQRANWSTLAKTRAWLVIQSCMKQLDAACKTDTGIADHIDGCACSPYRVVIDRRRKHTATTRPDITAAHSLNDAMRVASKALLRDLWREARRIHEEKSA